MTSGDWADDQMINEKPVANKTQESQEARAESGRYHPEWLVRRDDRHWTGP